MTNCCFFFGVLRALYVNKVFAELRTNLREGPLRLASMQDGKSKSPFSGAKSVSPKETGDTSENNYFTARAEPKRSTGEVTEADGKNLEDDFEEVGVGEGETCSGLTS